ncbi:MAG: fibronectin type III domain-containing protein, partial [Hymenobacter sp.]
PVSAPLKFTAADGPTKGSVELRQNAQGGTKAYVYEYALAPTDGSAPQWCYCLGTTASCVVSGLSSGQQYLFRVAAWNGMGTAPYSQIETRYVQ